MMITHTTPGPLPARKADRRATWRHHSADEYHPPPLTPEGQTEGSTRHLGR